MRLIVALVALCLSSTDVISSQTPVYVGFVMNGFYRMSTLLTSYDAVRFSEFEGKFPDGYPRINATGYDAANSTECIPLYQARSQCNAQLSVLNIAAAIFTIDFGFEGAHSNSQRTEKLRRVWTNSRRMAIISSRTPIPLLCKGKVKEVVAANCFCQPDRVPFAGVSSDPAETAAGKPIFDIVNSYYILSMFLADASTRRRPAFSSTKQLVNARTIAEAVYRQFTISRRPRFLMSVSCFLTLVGKKNQSVVTNATGGDYYFWIGYSKGDDGRWIWEDNSQDLYTNWDVNEPSSAAVAKCAYVDQSQAKLPGAGNCQIVFPYVCGQWATRTADSSQ
ncbi:hypothetical protein PRIPAC_78880, partial [Pristionchus pacificus]|uniref:C-type lectin n=1 Tax=Pristionchus pacificus TaxID=54126 RepID=A0A2A6CP90_PRIPA